MSSSKFKIDNKELLRALGIAQTTRGRDHNRTFSHHNNSSMFQESDSAFEMTKKFDHNHSTIASPNIEQDESTEDRGQLLFALDIDISEDQKDYLEVYTKDKPYDLARSFCEKHGIEQEIADVIASRIVENAKLALLSKESSVLEAQFPEIVDYEEKRATACYNHNWVLPKGGDESVDDTLSPSRVDERSLVMREKDMNSESGDKRMSSIGKGQKQYELLTSGADEVLSRFVGSTKDTKNTSFVTPMFTEENYSPVKSQGRRMTTTDRFYEKTLRDIENRARNDAYIVEMHNQEKYRECTFHPSINTTSLKLARDRKRDLSTENLLLLRGKITEERRMVIKQNLRQKENKKMTFRPEINKRSIYLDEKNKPNYEQRERFEDLYQEYKILHEKRNQLKSRMNTEYSFTPKVSHRKKSEHDRPNFMERLAEDIEKRKTKKLNEEEENQEPLPTFCPKILKNTSDGSRNIDKLPVGEYLYKMSQQIEERKTELREAADRELRANAPKCTVKSETIVQAKIKRGLQMIFEDLDTDKDGLISADQINLETAPHVLAKMLGSLCEEMKRTESRQDLAQFTESCNRLLKVADPTVKSYLMLELPKVKNGSPQKIYHQVELVFHPQIDGKSKRIAEIGEERQGRSVYNRLYAEKTKSEVRLRELREKAADDELKECSFRPVINKYYGCTEAFYEKMFAQAGTSS